MAAAHELDPRIELLVLLGGDAGLRRGEIIALEQRDCDTRRGLLHVRRSEWKGHVTLPKGGRERQVNTTDRLRAVLTASRLKELAGHTTLATTMRYMHLSPAPNRSGRWSSAVRCLGPSPARTPTGLKVI